MDFLSSAATYVVPFVIILTVLVFVHELGHFLVARRNGVKVEVFSIGFGPELFGYTARSGTRWKFSAIPLGGYVKMFGDSDAASSGTNPGLEQMSEADKAVSFHHKRVGQRAAIAAAGPIANFLFAIVILSGLYMVVGQNATTPTIEEVQPDSAAAAAGLKSGDTVKRIDGSAIDRFEDMQRIVQLHPVEPLNMEVLRGTETITVVVTPRMKEFTDRFGNVQKIGLLGVTAKPGKPVRLDPLTAVGHAVKETWSLVTGTLQALWQIVAGTRSTDGIGGVLSIAHMSGEVARDGFAYTLSFMALLSINLGLINLFPIPILDGGHLLFCAAEALRGRPLGQRIQEIGAMAGLAAVVALMLFATWNDLVHLRVVAFFASLIS